jgi:signal transduction histidine kinase
LKGTRSKQNRSFFLATVLTGTWSAFPFLTSLPESSHMALTITRALYVFASFVPTAWFYFLIHFLDDKRQNKKLFICYFLSVFFASVSFTPLLVKGVIRFAPNFSPQAGPLYLLFVLFFSAIFTSILIHLYIELKASKGYRKSQLIYVTWAYLMGAISGAVHFISAYTGKEIIPHDIFLIIYPCILAYAIIKYSLMDIRLTITRTGIFIGVYTLVLGLPFLLGVFGKNTLIKHWGDNWWLGPLALIAVLATAGPFAYIYFQKRAEAILLREQHKYQEILRQTAMGMTRIRNPRQLLNLIVDILIKNVHITHSAVYLADAGYTQFIMRSCRNFKKGQADSINAKSKLLLWLENNKKPLLYDEIARKAQDETGPEQVFKKIEEEMRLLNAVVVVPSFLEDKLVSIITLGEKSSGKTYTSEDLNIFSVLAGQSALAIENALLYENIEKKVKERTKELVDLQKQLVQAEKLATVGTLAGGVAHEINNPLTAILTSVQMLLASGGKIDAEFDRESLELIEEATKRCRTIVQKLMVYARKPLGTSDISRVDLMEIVKNVDSFLNFQLAQDNIKIVIDAPEDKYLVMGNRNELEQVATNMVLNARDAIKQAKKAGRVSISLSKNDGQICLKIYDDGCGIPENILYKIFDPFFTTKDVGKGLGLGLSISQSIIEKHNGSISVQSEGNKGTTFTVQLPRLEVEAEVKSRT